MLRRPRIFHPRSPPPLLRAWVDTICNFRTRFSALTLSCSFLPFFFARPRSEAVMQITIEMTWKCLVWRVERKNVVWGRKKNEIAVAMSSGSSKKVLHIYGRQPQERNCPEKWESGCGGEAGSWRWKVASAWHSKIMSVLQPKEHLSWTVRIMSYLIVASKCNLNLLPQPLKELNGWMAEWLNGWTAGMGKTNAKSIYRFINNVTLRLCTLIIQLAIM